MFNIAATLSRYMDPLTSFGFKKLFGNEANKDIIISFITDVLELEAPLRDIYFLDKEQLPESGEELAGIYDIYCHDVAGNRFIVEMQKNRMNFLYQEDRAGFYGTFPIVAYAKKTGNFLSYFNAAIKRMRMANPNGLINEKKSAKIVKECSVNTVYCIAVLDYAVDDSTKVINRSGPGDAGLPEEVFQNKLQFVTIELPLFNETLPEYSLDSHLNKWLYFLNYLDACDMKPTLFDDDVVFQKAFQVADVVSYTREELRAYNFSLKHQWDAYAVFKTAYDEGVKAGMEKGLAKGERIRCKIADCLRHLTHKFGSIPPDIEKTIRAMDNEYQIDSISSHISVIEEGETLRKLLPSKNSIESC